MSMYCHNMLPLNEFHSDNLPALLYSAVCYMRTRKELVCQMIRSDGANQTEERDDLQTNERQSFCNGLHGPLSYPSNILGLKK